jgi:ABC-type sugar transport system ATPase subunit
VDRTTSGETSLNRKSVHLNSPRHAVQAGIALLTEDRKRDGLVMSCSITDNASLATLNQVSRWIFLNIGKRNARVQGKVHELSINPRQINRLVQLLGTRMC